MNKQIESTDWLIRRYSEEEATNMKAKAIKEAEVELREKQIEEMAYEMTQYKGKMCERIEKNNCLLKFHTNAFVNCNFCKLAEYLITEKDYRRQSDGEWVYHECVASYDGAISGYSCSCCSAFIHEEVYEDTSFPNKFCPNCGAKMKGVKQ